MPREKTSEAELVKSAEQEFNSHQGGLEPGAIDAFPAQELFQLINERTPVDWKQKWVQCGGRMVARRMIALKTDPIWSKLSQFDLPYPPFDEYDVMAVRDIGYTEAVELGVASKGIKLEPKLRSWSDDLKQLMKHLAVLLCGALVCGSAQARLGETTEEIIKRYGPPTTSEVSEMFGLLKTNYLFKEYVVTVYFKNGKSIKEEIKPKAKREMKEEECLALIKAIGPGSWEKVGDMLYWKRADGATAMLVSELFIETPEFDAHRTAYLNRKEEIEKADAKKKAEGF